MSTHHTIPRIMIAALKGGAGKTFITTGLLAAFCRRGLAPAVFKKGPDYIDAGWLGLAAGTDCYNLDTYLMPSETVVRSFVSRSLGKEIAVVEGNRGLFDGVDTQGTYSTAELAKLLQVPVVLIVDATKMTRTAAAVVLGCREMDPAMTLKGVILNRVAGARHERVLRQAIEEATGIPVVGSVGKLASTNFPQRHLGLLPLHEHPLARDFVDEAASLAEQSVDLGRLVRIAGDAPAFLCDLPAASEFPEPGTRAGLRIGVIRDSAFQFYYPENLEALERSAGSLISVTALEPAELPDLDALYIGGGFPETHAEQLAQNVVFKRSLLRAITRGLPVYAECGGLMYLARNLCIDDRVYPMVGAFPIDTTLQKSPKGLGYIRVQVEKPNPFYPVAAVLTGHEFHYSFVPGLAEMDASCAFKVLRGHGMDGVRDGFWQYNALGTYMHVHALGEPSWAEAIVRRAREYRKANANRGNS
ncbi:MAG: cobyrinate a,c-diamide synthase [Desulfomonile tiedjei]|nr:cobyrinate a,c-diamide synthase [Desulfomonile tiedjei]